MSSDSTIGEASQRRFPVKANSVLPSAVGLLVASAVLYDLATTDAPPEIPDGSVVEIISPDVLENLLGAALPQSASDVLAVALGEGIGGVVGAGATALVTSAIRLRSSLVAAAATDDGGGGKYLLAGGGEPLMNRAFATEALAGADYFLTRAAVLPLLISVGIDPFVASISSVFVASVPYELVKLNERLRQGRKSENELLDELLREEMGRQRSGNFFVRAPQKVAVAQTSVDLSTLRPVSSRTELDIPELITDLVKWLEFDVLKNKYGGELVVFGDVLSGGAESAVFGFLAALSSQLYLDALYQITDLGPDDKKKEAQTRSGADLVAVYSTRCFSTAALFSVYEYVKLPAKLIIGSLLSGGVEGCVGSTNFEACVETFQYFNPADGASFEADLRALAVAIASLAQRLLGT